MRTSGLLDWLCYATMKRLHDRPFEGLCRQGDLVSWEGEPPVPPFTPDSVNGWSRDWWKNFTAHRNRWPEVPLQTFRRLQRRGLVVFRRGAWVLSPKGERAVHFHYNRHRAGLSVYRFGVRRLDQPVVSRYRIREKSERARLLHLPPHARYGPPVYEDDPPAPPPRRERPRGVVRRGYRRDRVAEQLEIEEQRSEP